MQTSEGLGVWMEGPLGRREVDSAAAETMGSCWVGALCLSRLPACLSLSFLMCITRETVSLSLGKGME